MYLIPEEMLKFLALDFIHKFSNNLTKYFNREIYNTFLKQSLNTFTESISLNILENMRHMTILAASCVLYQIKNLKLKNIGIYEICNQFHLKEKNILEMYQKLTEKMK